MGRTKLLAPAGDLTRLKWAVIYGADEVYLGLEDFSLRAFATNFSLNDVKKGVDFAHKHGVKVFVTLNIYPWTEEFSQILDIAKVLEKYNVDAFIVSDLGLFFELKKCCKTPIHISTQANSVNFFTIKSWHSLGAKRVNIAREVNFERIKQIVDLRKRQHIPVELEVFIHGAVCFSYSGRCAFSEYMNKTLERAGNRGACTQPCRWKYYVMEEKRPGEYMPVFEDNRGLYIFNSKDLALFRYVPKLQYLGIDSIKIEGRMKTIHYVASVVWLYRRILDGYQFSDKEALKYVSRVATRGFSEGFMKGDVIKDDYIFTEDYKANIATFVANTLTDKEIEEFKMFSIKTLGKDLYKSLKNENKTILRTRNRIQKGDILEVLSPTNNKMLEYKMDEINIINKKTGQINKSDVVHNDNYIVINGNYSEYTIFRKIV